MPSRQMGLVSSWRLLRKEKGWWKPLVVLALVGWIPVLGQTAVLGYAYEWARLSAWGLDRAPKRHGVDYSKLLTSGGICFLVMLTMRVAIGAICRVLFGFTDSNGWMPMGMVLGFGSMLRCGMLRDANDVVGSLVEILLGSFVMCAMMQATVYDSFKAGWRVDRLFQMIGRDPKGFLKLYVSVVMASLVVWSYWLLCALLLTSLVFWLGAMALLSSASYFSDITSMVTLMARIGALPLLACSVVVLAMLFLGAVIANAMQLVSINVAGQWFRRFDVARWGVSSAPLPDGVPIHSPDGAGDQ